MVPRVALAALVALGIGAAARQTTDPSAAQAAWVRAHALTVKTVQAGSGFDDLQKLAPSIGTARIVSLGEATHGTREIFQMKHRLVEFLASEQGFTIFAIEANMPEAYRVNDYVLHGTGDPKALLKGMYFWTWNTEEVLAMIEWMRQFNASGDRIYEKCTRQPGDKVLIELRGEDRIGHAEENPRIVNSAEYRRCFGGLQKTAGKFLQPQ